jgi:hypothetical protein
MIKWLASTGHFVKELLGLEAPKTKHHQSIMERLEGLIPPVEVIRDSYKIDRSIAEAGREAMLAVEKLMKETERLVSKTLAQQKQSIEVQDLLLEQQEITGNIIDVQYYKSLDAETVIMNLREWMLGDDKTVAWFLENVLVPAWVNGFAQQTEARQRKLFNGLSVAVNLLKRLDGILVEPE